MLVYQMVTPNIKFTGTHLYMYIWVEFTQPILWSSICVEIYIELQCVYDSAPYETSRSAADLQQICFDKNRSTAD